jgi:hypothetical protein
MFDDPAHLTSSGRLVENLDPADARASVVEAVYDTVDVPLTADEALAWVEQTPLGPDNAGLLFDLEPCELDEGGRIRLAAQLQRLENAIAGRKMAAVAAFAGPVPANAPVPEQPAELMSSEPSGPDFTDCEIAVALSLSQPAAQRVVSTARRLTSHLPRTLAALSAGTLGYLATLRIVEGAAELDSEQCRRLERLVLPTAAGKAPGLIARAVRKAVARIDAEALARDQRKAKQDAFFDVSADDGLETGLGHVSGQGPHVEAAVVRAAVEAWARAAKAKGDPRSLDQLRWAALHDWSARYLTGRDPAHVCDSGIAGGRAPTSHGSPIVINIAVDLTTFLGLTSHPLEILGTGALIPAAALADLIPDAGFRRMLTDPATGHLLDLSPHIYRPSAEMGRFIQLLHVTSSGPNSTVPATDVDIDHGEPFDPGLTIRDNLHPPNRKWHNAKTVGGWTVKQNSDRTWTWTSPHRLTHKTAPHDYRLGPSVTADRRLRRGDNGALAHDGDAAGADQVATLAVVLLVHTKRCTGLYRDVLVDDRAVDDGAAADFCVVEEYGAVDLRLRVDVYAGRDDASPYRRAGHDDAWTDQRLDGRTGPAGLVMHELRRWQRWVRGEDRPLAVVEVEHRMHRHQVLMRVVVRVDRPDVTPVATVSVRLTRDNVVGEVIDVRTALADHHRDDVAAHVMHGPLIARVDAQRIDEHFGGEHVVAHGGKDLVGCIRQTGRIGGLFEERVDALAVRRLDDSERRRTLPRHPYACDRHASSGLDVPLDHLPRVHPVHVVSAEDDDMVGRLVVHQVQALVDRVG